MHKRDTLNHPLSYTVATGRLTVDFPVNFSFPPFPNFPVPFLPLRALHVQTLRACNFSWVSYVIIGKVVGQISHPSISLKIT